MSTRLRSLAAFLSALAASVPLGAQEPADFRGTVLETLGPPVVSASVILLRPGVEAPFRGALTDRLGAFRLPGVPPGRYELRVERLGFETHTRVLDLVPGRNEIEVELTPAAVELEGVRVEAERSRERTRFEESAGITVREVSGAELRMIPGLAETDPIRAMEVLPGVVSTSDFAAAFNVRGGSADQNLILLDGIPIFNPFHLGGFFSVFNGDMVARAELATGGFPARQGGRVSSVLSVDTDPGAGELQVDAGISLLASRLAVAGGVPEGVEESLGLRQVRWRTSARRSYLDVLLRPVVDLPYALTDFQGFVEGWTEGGTRIAVTGYTGSDVLNLTNIDPRDFPLRIRWDWGNDVAGVQVTRPRPGGGSLDLRAGYSRFATGLRFPDFDDTDFRSRIDQVTLQGDLEGRPSPNSTLRIGVSADRQSYDNLAASGGTQFAAGVGRGWLLGTYLQADLRSGPWLVEAGVRLDAWQPEGETGATVPGPRLAVKRFLGTERDWALKFAAGRYSQFLHSIRDEELPLGLDIWVLAGDRVPHAVSDQVQGGVEGFLGDRWSLTLEGYHRWFDGMVANNLAEDPNDPLDDLLRGTGRSYGADLFLRRNGPGLSGWLSLSWLRATRTFEDIFSGQVPAPVLTYAPIFDRRVDLDLVLQVPLPWEVQGGVRFTYGTGLPYTPPVSAFDLYGPRFSAQGRLIWQGDNGEAEAEEDPPTGVILAPRNSVRYPAYHRLDVSARRPFRRSWGRITPYVDILNVYNQRNVLFYFHQYREAPFTRSGISMFPLLPTVGFEVNF